MVAANGSTWVRTDVADPWEIDDPLTIGDPLDPLRHPTDVRWESADGDINIYQADYQASLFGLPDGPSLTLSISAHPDQIVYRYESDGAAVEMSLVKAADLTPIELPTTLQRAEPASQDQDPVVTYTISPLRGPLAVTS